MDQKQHLRGFPVTPSNLDHMSEWSEQLVTRMAATLRARRTQLGLSVQQVADRTADLGHPLNRSTLSDLENGRRKDRLMIGDALALAEVLRIPLGQLLYPSQPDGKVEAYPGVELSSYVAAQSLSNGLPLGEDDLVPTEDGTGHYLKGERAGEIISGYELATSVQDLMQARADLSEMQRELDAAITRADVDIIPTYRRRIDSLQRLVDMYTAVVRKHGGVVNDG